MQSKATTVAGYLAELPSERRTALEAVRRVIRDSVDQDVEEGMQYGMIGYFVPHRVVPEGYHVDSRRPVPFISLASQKNYMTLYLFFAYTGGDSDAWIRQAYQRAGRRLDMGKCCVRFRRLEDLDLGIVGEAIRRVPTATFLKTYFGALGAHARTRPTAKAGAGAKARVKGRARARTTARPRDRQ